MANDLTGNPLFVDTVAGAKTGEMTLQLVVWTADETGTKDIAADDDFKLTDAEGRFLCGKRATFAGDDGAWPLPLGLPVNGVIVSKLDGGVCTIYTKD